MSSIFKSTGATLFYWASGARGGKGVGHLALKLGDGTYISHVPDKSAGSSHLLSWKRNDVPGMIGVNQTIYRWPTWRNRTFEADEALFGKNLQSLTLPSNFIDLYMSQYAAGRMLASSPESPPLHGPLPYYQLADSVKGAGDRSQCATTTAAVIAAGVPLTHQEVGAEILAKYDPDSLWDTVLALARKFTGGT
jgi:hypothetical protein